MISKCLLIIAYTDSLCGSLHSSIPIHFLDIFLQKLTKKCSVLQATNLLVTYYQPSPRESSGRLNLPLFSAPCFLDVLAQKRDFKFGWIPLLQVLYSSTLLSLITSYTITHTTFFYMCYLLKLYNHLMRCLLFYPYFYG